jgi:MFS family permease
LKLPFRFLPRTVIVLGAVSLLNDAASEMIAPLLPIFLTTTLGAGPAVVGAVEGLAEATASLLKLLSGRLADRGWNRKGLVLGGYTLSNAVRPLIGLALGWVWVMVLRFADRVGKGLRTSPRDAMIAGVVAPERRGLAFGFHRAMDHFGAMVGPLLAFALLQSQFDLRHVFLFSLGPGLLVIALLAFSLPEVSQPVPAGPQPRLAWGALDRRLRALVLASGALALATAPEVFLVLWAQLRGISIAWVPLLWAAAHAAKTLVAVPAGRLSDHLGRLPVVTIGWGLRVALLLALGLSTGNGLTVWGLFLGYASALAFTEGAERALVGDFAPAEQKASAFGLYHMLNGLLALPGGLLFGAIWQAFGVTAAFVTASALTAAAALWLVWLMRGRPLAE